MFQGQSIYLESDSLLSVQAIKECVQNYLKARVLLEQCRSLLSSQARVARVSLGLVKKHANKVAYLLIMLSCMLNSFIDFSSPPHLCWRLLCRIFDLMEKKIIQKKIVNKIFGLFSLVSQTIMYG